jgi:hypothetical protein
MSNQTLVGSLVELPNWLQAAGWGLLSASGLLIGAVGGYYTGLQHTSVARLMTFASGVLLAVVAVDLVIEARDAASLQSSVNFAFVDQVVRTMSSSRSTTTAARTTPSVTPVQAPVTLLLLRMV